jgi:hypothetical protein
MAAAPAELVEAGLELGAPLPRFQGLPATDGGRYSSSSFDGSGQLVLVFVGNGCPSVKAYGDEFNLMQQLYGPGGAQFVAVNSNNAALSPPDTLADMVKVADARGWIFPYLKDADSVLARGCGALATPHAFVFDAERRLRYRGRLTDSRDPSRATSSDLTDAIADLQAGRRVRVPETEPIGCSIVW